MNTWIIAAALGVALSAGGASFVFAQAGSTGGTLGNTDKSISGSTRGTLGNTDRSISGERRVEPPGQEEPRESKPRSARKADTPEASAPSALGKWGCAARNRAGYWGNSAAADTEARARTIALELCSKAGVVNAALLVASLTLVPTSRQTQHGHLLTP